MQFLESFKSFCGCLTRFTAFSNTPLAVLLLVGVFLVLQPFPSVAQDVFKGPITDYSNYPLQLAPTEMYGKCSAADYAAQMAETRKDLYSPNEFGITTYAGHVNPRELEGSSRSQKNQFFVWMGSGEAPQPEIDRTTFDYVYTLVPKIIDNMQKGARNKPHAYTYPALCSEQAYDLEKGLSQCRSHGFTFGAGMDGICCAHKTTSCQPVPLGIELNVNGTMRPLYTIFVLSNCPNAQSALRKPAARAYTGTMPPVESTICCTNTTPCCGAENLQSRLPFNQDLLPPMACDGTVVGGSSGSTSSSGAPANCIPAPQTLETQMSVAKNLPARSKVVNTQCCSGVGTIDRCTDNLQFPALKDCNVRCSDCEAIEDADIISYNGKRAASCQYADRCTPAGSSSSSSGSSSTSSSSSSSGSSTGSTSTSSTSTTSSSGAGGDDPYNTPFPCAGALRPASDECPNCGYFFPAGEYACGEPLTWCAQFSNTEAWSRASEFEGNLQAGLAACENGTSVLSNQFYTECCPTNRCQINQPGSPDYEAYGPISAWYHCNGGLR